MQTESATRLWNTRRADKAGRLARAAAHADGRVVRAAGIVAFLQAVIAPGDRVVL